MIQAISFGAGVQSTTLALMAAKGEIGPMPDLAIFADTGWEPKAVYDQLAWIKPLLPFPVHVVRQGNLRADLIQHQNSTGQRFAAVPWHMLKPDGKRGIGRRQCSAEYKLRPIQRRIKEVASKRRGVLAKMWLGISVDEASRMKPARVKYIENRYPLIEMGMSRNSCLVWLDKHGYPRPPKSSCIGCPYHSNEQWRSLSADEFADAVEVDRIIRHQPKFRAEQYMHSSLMPLDKVDFRTPEEMGQMNMFENECEGICAL